MILKLPVGQVDHFTVTRHTVIHLQSNLLYVMGSLKEETKV